MEEWGEEDSVELTSGLDPKTEEVTQFAKQLWGKGGKNSYRCMKIKIDRNPECLGRAGFSSDDFVLCLWIVFIVGLCGPPPEGV